MILYKCLKCGLNLTEVEILYIKLTHCPRCVTNPLECFMPIKI